MELQKLKEQLIKLEEEKNTLTDLIESNRKIQEQNVATFNFKTGQVEMLKSLILVMENTSGD